MIQLNRTVAAGASRVGVFDLSGRRDEDGADHVCVPGPSQLEPAYHFATHTNNSGRTEHFRPQRTYQRPSARPSGRARRATVSMLEIGGVRSSALPHRAAFSALPSEAGRNSGFFLHPSAQSYSNAHWSALGGPTSAPEAPPRLPRTHHRNSTTPYGSYAPTGILTQQQ